MKIFEEAKALSEQLVADRRVIHQNPEFGMELPQTVAYVKKRLTEMGYEPKDCGKAGVVATVGKPGKCILLRADMDALPMMEETGLPFASTNGYTHSCGHDAHTAMLLCAAKLLKEHEAELNGTVKFMFQPAEEILAGAKDMVENGILENPKVDAAMGLHIHSESPSGFLIYSPKYVCASADAFTFTVTGKGGHGASPEKAIDPLVTAAYLVLALQEIQTREISGQDTIVITFGELHSGEKENIIPTTAKLRGTVRAFDAESRKYVKRRMEEIGKAIGLAYRCEIDLNWDFSCDPNSNDEALMEEMLGYMTEVVGPEKVLPFKPQMGSEDFAAVSSAVPSVFCWVGVCREGDDNPYPMHNPKVIIDEEAMPTGAALYANCAINWLKNNG